MNEEMSKPLENLSGASVRGDAYDPNSDAWSGAAIRSEAVAREYFYKVDSCKAEDGKSPECICWHKEGTGPLASRPHEVANWRPATVKVSARAADAPFEPSESEKLDTDQSREYLVKFMEQHFTDKTYHRYIRGDRGAGNLAGDFAWQMARALRRIEAGVAKSRAADALDSQPCTDEPTERESLIACLGDDAATLSAANPDDEMAQTMREAAAMLENDSKALDEVLGCFRAAEAEGLFIALAETNDVRLKDLVERRLMHARYAAERIEVASSQPTDGAPAQQLYRFKRINKGVVMADGIGVHASTMEEAVEKAQKLKDPGDIAEFESNKPCVRKCEICQPTDGGVRNG